MIRTLIVATSFALAANAFAAGAPAPAPAPRMAPMAAQQPAGDWHNTIHPIPAGNGGDQRATMAPSEVIQGAPATKDGTVDGGWHNTIHPIPPGSGGEGTTTSRNASNTSDVDGGWHNTVHPIPPAGAPRSKHHRPPSQR